MVFLKRISDFVFEDIYGSNEPLFLLVNCSGSFGYMHQSGYGILNEDMVTIVDA